MELNKRFSALYHIADPSPMEYYARQLMDGLYERGVVSNTSFPMPLPNWSDDADLENIIKALDMIKADIQGMLKQHDFECSNGRVAPEGLFHKRLLNIMKQLSIDQQEVLFESLMEVPKFRPEGWPTKYKVMDFDEYTDEEIKYIHDWFITLQYSDDPTLEGEDIRGVQIYPYLEL